MSKADGQYIGIQFTEEIISDMDAILGYIFKDGAQDCIAYVSSQYSSYGASNLIDGDTSTYWLIYPIPANTYVRFTLPEARVVNAVKMWLKINNYPKTFEIYGSNDNTNYTKLGEVLSANVTVTGWYTFEFGNNTPYLYYKIVFLTHNSDSPWSPYSRH